MKKLVLISLLVMSAIFVNGQMLQKGALLGLHKVAPVLSTGVTMEQYLAFLKDKLIPAYEKNYPGLKCYLMKSIRGENAGSTLIVFYFQSEEIRNKYFKPDGDYTELGLEGKLKMQSVLDEMARLDSSKEVYTDYVIQ